MRDLVSTVALLGVLQGGPRAPPVGSPREQPRQPDPRGPRRRSRPHAAPRRSRGSLGLPRPPHLLGLGAPLPFLFGPLVYLYVITFRAGLRGGARFGPVEIVAKGGLEETGQLKALVAPFYATLGRGFAF